MNLAAVVVTYNRKEELIKNIETIMNQKLVVDKYYIIDNHGNDGTEEYLKSKKILPNERIIYVYLDKNIGGAGGFYTGLKMAYDDGYDYICLMDDDGRPENENMMLNLVNKANMLRRENELLLLNSLVCSSDGNQLSFGLNETVSTKQEAIKNMDDNGLIMNYINPFNGTLVSRALIDKIGFPNKDFFIKGDETDYFRRSIKAGAYVATVVDSNYYHPALQKNEMRFLWKKIRGSSEAAWKEYYRARNYTYMYTRNNEKRYIKENIKQIIFALKFNKNRFKTIKMIIKGWKDGIRGNLGASVKP